MKFSPDGAFHRLISTQATCGEANRTRCDNGTAVGHRLKLAALGRRAGVDVILVVPRRDLQREPIDAGVARRLAEGGVKVRHVDWVAPPQLSPGVPLESGGCCGAREFMKLHAFGFADYDAVAVVDNDFDVDDVERLRPIFDCAAAGHVITTRGAHSAVNGAFAAVPPSEALRDALLAALSTATARRPAPGPRPPDARRTRLWQVDRETGWNGAGWGPFHRKFDARMQVCAPRPRGRARSRNPPAP